MRVLSLFDGMSCGQIALRELGVNVEKYYASEVDKFAIAQTALNFPDTIELGNVENWREWNIDWGKIDLLIGGSPCQGFSFAGKQLAFDDPRSRLFFVYVNILNHLRKYNPRIKFLLENVVMKKEHINVITECLGIYPVMVNSALVSAQSRKRLYWSNIQTRTEGLFGDVYTDIPQPIDRGLVIKDILDKEVDEKYYLRKEVVATLLEHKKNEKDKGHGFGFNPRRMTEKMNTLSVGGRGMCDLVEVGIYQRPRGENNGGIHLKKAPTLTSFSYDQNNVVLQPLGGVFRTHYNGRGFRPFSRDEFGTLTARAREDGSGQLCAALQGRIRRLTPTECARLQTIPEWYKWACSDSQAYKMLGNGWTVEVIKHIFSFLEI